MVRLELALAGAIDLGRVASTFGGPEAPWLGERAPDGPTGIRRFGGLIQVADAAIRGLDPLCKAVEAGNHPPKSDRQSS